jgi:hypothetical protein
MRSNNPTSRFEKLLFTSTAMLPESLKNTLVRWYSCFIFSKSKEGSSSNADPSRPSRTTAVFIVAVAATVPEDELS